ncbi:MAG: hypothetical protein E6J97_06175 [Methanobacteriota archaeon]|nr:MAG: hypothetical protein E6J97_06175 [Euryarchaeota archaeon]
MYGADRYSATNAASPPGYAATRFANTAFVGATVRPRSTRPAWASFTKTSTSPGFGGAAGAPGFSSGFFAAGSAFAAFSVGAGFAAGGAFGFSCGSSFFSSGFPFSGLSFFQNRRGICRGNPGGS